MLKFRFPVVPALLVLLASCGAPYQFAGTLLEPAKPLTALTLTDTNGQPFPLKETGGKLTLIYFGYTNCPDACPATMGDWKQIKQQLGAQADKVRFVMVSIDPQRDTEPVLAKYLATFDPAFIGLRPTPEQLATLNTEYGLGVDMAGMSNHDDNAVMHGTYSYVLDQQGNMRLLLRSDIEPSAMTSDIAALLQ